MNVTPIFFNDKQRLRSGWRVALFLAVCSIASIIIGNLVFGILTALPIGFSRENPMSFAISYVIAAVFAIVFGWLFVKLLEDVPFRALIFFNDKERLRSGWRVALFLAVYFLILTFVVNIAFEILTALPIGFSRESLLSFTVSHGISAALVIIFGWLFGKFLEDLPFRALGAAFTKNWLKHLSFGFIIGALTVCFGALIAYLSGGLNFEYNTAGFSAIGLTLGVSLIIFIGGAAFEEAFFRGYIFQTLSRAKLGWFAVLFTSLFFATVHNQNPNANFFSWCNTFLAGIWFAAAYWKTRTLWMPFGLHLAWNWFLGSILGIQVSGLSDLTTAPFLKAADLGPAWLTGGEYGLEGGLAGTIALIISILLIWFLPFIKPSDEMFELTSEERDFKTAEMN